MTIRRDAREWAVQLLFQLDMNADTLEKVFSDFWSDKKPDPAARQFAETLVRGVRENLDQIDDGIRKHSDKWDIKRIGVVERNVIRMAICEMLFCDDIPFKVSINEAVDITKYFSNSEAGRFVNGILDEFRKETFKDTPSPPFG
ncbi:transcription antitermination factor NusB [Verrucomicrobiota bacterium]